MATKQSLYFPEEMLREIMSEATRLDRSLSWMVQQAWRLTRAELQRLPAVTDRRVPEQDRERELGAGPGDREERAPSPQVLEFVRGKFDRGLMQ